MKVATSEEQRDPRRFRTTQRVLRSGAVRASLTDSDVDMLDEEPEPTARGNAPPVTPDKTNVSEKEDAEDKVRK